MEEKTRILNENEANASSSTESKQNIEKQTNNPKSRINKRTVENIVAGTAGLIVGGVAAAAATNNTNEHILQKDPVDTTSMQASTVKAHQTHKPVAQAVEKHEEKLIDVITDPEPEPTPIVIVVTDAHIADQLVNVDHKNEHHTDDEPIHVKTIEQDHEDMTIVPSGAFPDNEPDSHMRYEDLAQNDNYSSHDDSHII